MLHKILLLKLLDERSWNSCIFYFDYETYLENEDIYQKWSMYYMIFNIVWTSVVKMKHQLLWRTFFSFPGQMLFHSTYPSNLCSQNTLNFIPIPHCMHLEWIFIEFLRCTTISFWRHPISYKKQSQIFKLSNIFILKNHNFF